MKKTGSNFTPRCSIQKVYRDSMGPLYLLLRHYKGAKKTEQLFFTKLEFNTENK